MIPADIAADYGLWTASIAAARPLSKAGPLLKANLVAFGAGLLQRIEAALDASVGSLDGPDPAGYAADMIAALTALGTAATDQADLAALRGIAGRQLFNLRQA